MEVFAQSGYRRASMDQVAEAAGLTRQAVYHYFSSKAELFRASVEALHEGAHEAEAEAGLAAERPAQALPIFLPPKSMRAFATSLSAFRKPRSRKSFCPSGNRKRAT